MQNKRKQNLSSMLRLFVANLFVKIVFGEFAEIANYQA